MSKPKNSSVTITLVDRLGGVPKIINLPPRLLMVANAANGNGADGPKPVTKKNISALAGFKPSLQLEVPNRITDQPDSKLTVEVTFQTKTDGWVQALVQSVPALKALKQNRDSLIELRDAIQHNPRFRREFEAWLKSTSRTA